MQLFHNKKFRIAIIISVVLITIGVVIGFIGYNSACKIVKDFREDFKTVSKSDGFKNMLSLFKTSKIVVFLAKDKPFVGVLGFKFRNQTLYDKMVQLLEQKSDDLILFKGPEANLYFADKSENRGLSKILEDISFLAKIGFWLKSAPDVKFIYEISDFLKKTFNKTRENETKRVYFNILDEKKVQAYEVSYSVPRAPVFDCIKSFEFVSNKNITCDSFECITFIVHKLIRRGST
ncbi:hypothetical protein CWI38_0027p0040 [Hamiltosporidium tvaerminnensis]|uniref:Uncharacterized protein n=1 Tax=Hamiltosporidium tvaerminnensis TaxID=1176355 RepID=A0A4Q9M1X7_9MICR|nr:hypothetical protein CWI38_0487p0010 [Hamiltosporidium tvaerminnensis]TBU20744.1 hypothetical protein CWI38_0027p0040 [Hamiltosporidium tvaerminnensis]